MKDYDYTQSLLDENSQLKGCPPLEKLMKYRNLSREDMPDRDRCLLARTVYQKLGWLNDERYQEPDTFFASPYFHLKLMCAKQDKEQGDTNFYVTDFERYITENTKEDYNTISKSQAQYYRKLWFLQDTTMQHYNLFLKEPIISNYINAGHTIGAFHIIPKGFGYQPKCKWLLDDGIRSLKILEENWDFVKKHYDEISFEEYREKYFLNGAYKSGILNRKELKINFEDSWEHLFQVICNLTIFIHNRTELIIRKLQG